MIDALTATPGQTQAKFRRFAERNPACLQRSSFHSLVEVSRINGYPLQPWPTFVDPGDLLRLQRAAVGVTGLIKQIPGRVFGLDPGRLAEVYGCERREVDEAVTAIRGADCLAGSLARVDLVQCAGGWKCLEVNSTANLGGWQLSLLAGHYLGNPWISKFLAEEGLEAGCRRPTRTVFSHLARLARQRVRGIARECNTAVITDQPPPESQQALIRSEYHATLREEDPSLGGEVLVCDYIDLSLDGTRLLHRGRRIHAVMEQYEGYVPREVLASWLAGDAIVFNGPASRLLSDKRNLAILSQELDGTIFDEPERSLIAAHVPWTRVVRPGPASFRGETVDLAELLAGRREGFVLKPAWSARGEDVHVGKFTAPRRWAEALAEALAAGDRIAQEYVEPLAVDCQLGSEGSAPHEVVWGIFVMSDDYGGGFLRMMPRGGGDGVINSARGATEGPIFEVRARPQG